MRESVVDKYLNRNYDFNRYNCGHFVADIWKDLTGEDISIICDSFLEGKLESFRQKRQDRERLANPPDNGVCVVLMRNSSNDIHAGVWIDGQILHLTESGAKYEPLENISAIRNDEPVAYYYK
jgi:hypothetical protein